MTEPIVKKPLLPFQEFSLPELAKRAIRYDSSLPIFEFPKSFEPLSLELFRPENMPGIGHCGILRNNSAFGCSYLDSAGRETKLGMNFDTYPGGFGLSLKFFLGGR